MYVEMKAHKLTTVHGGPGGSFLFAVATGCFPTSPNGLAVANDEKLCCAQSTAVRVCESGTIVDLVLRYILHGFSLPSRYDWIVVVVDGDVLSWGCAFLFIPQTRLGQQRGNVRCAHKVEQFNVAGIYLLPDLAERREPCGPYFIDTA